MHLAKHELRLSMRAPIAAHFAKLWSAVAIEPPLWEGGGIHKPRDRHISPSSQSGVSATALQSASREMRKHHAEY